MIETIYESLSAMFAVFLTVLAGSTIMWMMEAWRDGKSVIREENRSVGGMQESLSISLLVPARHETAVLEHTVLGILACEYSNFDVVIIVGDDDPETAAIAWNLSYKYSSRVTVAIDYNPHKSKPSALNVGLDWCSGDIIGVFDAEDDVAPGILGAVAECFERTGAGIVQGGVQLINTRSKWFSVRNCLEYYLWYRSRLHWHVRRGSFLPLGGNTVFIRRSVLVAAGGWNDQSLTEDCELGVRLGRANTPVEVVYSPHTTTREETPLSLASFTRQRTRWGQGFLQVLAKHDWDGLPTLNQRLIALYTLLTPIWQALSVLALPIAIVGIAGLKVGENFAMFSFLPLLLLIWTVFLEVFALREFGRDFGIRIGARDIAMLVITTLPYQFVLSYSGLRAVYRHLKGHSNWEKTSHVGAHRNGLLEGAK